MTDPVHTVNIDLAALQSSLLVRLQHLLDMLAVSLLGAQSVDGTRYDGFSTFFNLSPAQNQRLSRDAAATEAANWYLRTTFRDAMEAAGLFLDETRKVAALYKAASSSSLTFGAFNEIIGAQAAKFHRLGFPDKLQALHSEFQINAGLASHVLTINAVRNCLVHRLGIVGQKDSDTGGVLTLRWNVFALFGQSSDGAQEVAIGPDNPVVGSGWSVVLKTIDRYRVFKQGERIDLSYEEIVHTFMTLMRFAMQVTETLQGKAPPPRPSPPRDSPPEHAE